jgi:hypothetical protein
MYGQEAELKRGDWRPGDTYFAYSLSAELSRDRLELTFDAMPRDEVVDYVRRLRNGNVTDQVARQVQRDYLAGPKRKNLIIRGTVPLRGEDLEGDIRGRFGVNRWYSMILVEAQGDDAPLTLWPMNNPLDEEPTKAILKRRRTLRGPLRRALDSLFTLRGSRDGGVEPVAPPPVDDPQDGRQHVRGNPKVLSAEWSAPDIKPWIHDHFNSICMLMRFAPEDLTPDKTRYVGVINVGQGSCVAVYNLMLQPIVYFDFGLPTTSYMHSAPWNLNYLRKHHSPFVPHGLNSENLRHSRPCLCWDPLVVLSHGHHDHWYGLNLLQQQFKNKRHPVLGPSMFTAPALGRLWSKLNTDTVAQKSCRSFPWGWVVACTGSNANSGGLASYVQVKDAPGRRYPNGGIGGTTYKKPVFLPDEEYVLLPGDADYDKIPGIQDPNLNLVGLVASHHGALLPPKAFSALPLSALPNSPIVYSYGLRDAGLSECMPLGRPVTVRKARQLNKRWASAAPIETQSRSYEASGGHPRIEAISSYEGLDWIERCNTAREEKGHRNAQQGNWLIGHAGITLMRGTTIKVCSSSTCPMNDGCRASWFQIA